MRRTRDRIEVRRDSLRASRRSLFQPIHMVWSAQNPLHSRKMAIRRVVTGARRQWWRFDQRRDPPVQSHREGVPVYGAQPIREECPRGHSPSRIMKSRHFRRAVRFSRELRRADHCTSPVCISQNLPTPHLGPHRPSRGARNPLCLEILASPVANDRSRIHRHSAAI